MSTPPADNRYRRDSRSGGELARQEDLAAAQVGSGETGVRLNPVSADQVRFTLRALAHSGVSADSSSQSSRSLQELVDKQRSILAAEAQSHLDWVVLLHLALNKIESWVREHRGTLDF